MSTELSPELEALMSRFSPAERAILEAEIAKKKRAPKGPKVAKELPPELIQAQAELDQFVAENSTLVNKLDSLRAAVGQYKKSVHIRVATKQFTFKPETGDLGIYSKPNNQLICVFKEKDWQSDFTGAGYTNGQVQAVYKAMSQLKKKAEAPVA